MAAPAVSRPAADRDSRWSESALWGDFKQGWKPLWGRFYEEGFSLEWHELEVKGEFDWARTFHPESLEICLNLTGGGWLSDGRTTVDLEDMTYGFYAPGSQGLRGRRVSGRSHRFLTVELSTGLLRSTVGGRIDQLQPALRRFAGDGDDRGFVGPFRPMTGALQQLLESLRQPPVHVGAVPLWYRAKVIELISVICFEEKETEFFCTRQKRTAQDRVDQVIALLTENMNAAPTLEQMAVKVGCSPYYLSRTFSKETGMTIPQYLRKLRMNRAGELLRAGRMNVTEVALEVGYNSISHFSQAFCQTMGCCPAMYPMKK